MPPTPVTYQIASFVRFESTVPECHGEYSKPCLKRSLLNTNMGFQDQLSLNSGQKYCRMLQGEHSAILSTCIKLPHDFKTFVLSIFEWPLMTVFTVSSLYGRDYPHYLSSSLKKTAILPDPQNPWGPFFTIYFDDRGRAFIRNF